MAGLPKHGQACWHPARPTRRSFGSSSLSERKIRQGSERLIGQEWAARSESGCTFGSAGDVPSLVFRASSQLTRRSVGAQHIQSYEYDGQTDLTPSSYGALQTHEGDWT